MLGNICHQFLKFGPQLTDPWQPPLQLTSVLLYVWETFCKMDPPFFSPSMLGFGIRHSHQVGKTILLVCTYYLDNLYFVSNLKWPWHDMKYFAKKFPRSKNVLSPSWILSPHYSLQTPPRPRRAGCREGPTVGSSMLVLCKCFLLPLLNPPLPLPCIGCICD